MAALVAATAACGLLASFLLLEMGVTIMVIRYPLAVAFAYCAFLTLVSVWLKRFRLRATESPRVRDGFGLDIVEVPLDRMWNPPVSEPMIAEFGGGGGFNGAGASGDWSDLSAAVPSPSAVSTSGSSGSGGLDVDLDEGAVWLIPVAIVVALSAGVLIYVITVAPTLFAELLLDAGLAAGLYRRLARVERRHWLMTAIQNTVLPALAVAGLLAIAGHIMQSVYPDAVSIGGVARHIHARQTGAS